VKRIGVLSTSTRWVHLEHHLHLVSKNQLNFHKQMHREAGTIASKCYTEDHQVRFVKHDPLADQTKHCNLLTGQGIVKITVKLLILCTPWPPMLSVLLVR
jgi:hypothetical protein